MFRKINARLGRRRGLAAGLTTAIAGTLTAILLTLSAMLLSRGTPPRSQEKLMAMAQRSP